MTALYLLQQIIVGYTCTLSEIALWESFASRELPIGMTCARCRLCVLSPRRAADQWITLAESQSPTLDAFKTP